MKEWIISGNFHTFLAAVCILCLGAMVGLSLPKKLGPVSMTEILVAVIHLLVIAAAVAGLTYKEEIQLFKAKIEPCQKSLESHRE